MTNLNEAEDGSFNGVIRIRFEGANDLWSLNQQMGGFKMKTIKGAQGIAKRSSISCKQQPYFATFLLYFS